ncbi:extracellular solute-binding protein [Devosia sp. A8/3-2]|nr:extracellular solute-binding protein [Devosia sp. A8/3-2]
MISRDRKTLKFAEPEAVEAVTMLRDLYDAGVYENYDFAGAIDGMASGSSGMYLQTSALQGSLVAGAEGNYELRSSSMPRFGEKPTRLNNSGSALTIHATDPLKQRAARELMKFLTSEHGYTVITSEIGYLPLRPAIVNDPKYRPTGLPSIRWLPPIWSSWIVWNPGTRCPARTTARSARP